MQPISAKDALRAWEPRLRFFRISKARIRVWWSGVLPKSPIKYDKILGTARRQGCQKQFSFCVFLYAILRTEILEESYRPSAARYAQTFLSICVPHSNHRVFHTKSHFHNLRHLTNPNLAIITNSEFPTLYFLSQNPLCVQVCDFCVYAIVRRALPFCVIIKYAITYIWQQWPWPC